ncbi:hypothetical protein BGX28_001079 [Mortierella sp. GBA30]|nr:hypothetical protein BGX28_001079 [Mortierella sp. GBA30]
MSQSQDTTTPTLSPPISIPQEVNQSEALLQSYHSQVQNLKRLPVPYSDLYRTLASYDTLPLHSLCTDFRKMASELGIWLDTAERAVFSLEMDIKHDGTSGRQDIGELDMIMRRFHPNIDMLTELKDKVKSRVRTDTADVSVTDADNGKQVHIDGSKTEVAPMTEQELEQTAHTIQSSWSSLNDIMGKVKSVLISTRVRGDLLTQMEDVLAEVEEIGLGIDGFREELSLQALETSTPKSTHSVASPPPHSLHSASAESMVSITEDTKTKQINTEALTQLDSRIDFLGKIIEALTARIEALPFDDPKREEIRENYAQLLRLWDDAKARREKINEEVKERRWLTVFDQVAGQVESMMESVDRAVIHCKGLIDQIKAMVKDKVIPTAPIDREHLYTIFKSFEAKHKYYAPAINKMLNMLENGIESRMTRDTIVIQKHLDMKNKWEQLRSGLDRVELDMNDIEKMLDILDASIPSYAPTPPAQLPEKPLFAMRRSQTQTEWKSPGPPSLFQPSEQQSQQQHSPHIQRGRRPAATSLQTPADSPVSERSRPINIPPRPRPWSPSPSVSSLPSMLSPNMFTSQRSFSRSSSRSPSRITSDKPRPWCPSTSTTSPSIPGIPYAPSAAATYSPRSPSSAGFYRDTSPSPTSRLGAPLTRTRSTSCTPSLSRSTSLLKPTFSPVGSLSRLSTGIQAPRSTSPTPRATSPVPMRSKSPTPSMTPGGQKSSLMLPPPPAVASNSTRLRQHSAPGLPISTAQRRSSSPAGPSDRDSIIKAGSRPPFVFSPPAVRQKPANTASSRSTRQIGFQENSEGGHNSRQRRISLGSSSSTTTTSSSSHTASSLNSGTSGSTTVSTTTATNTNTGAEVSILEEPISPTSSASSSGSVVSRPQQQQSPSDKEAKTLPDLLNDMSMQQESVYPPYQPVRGDELDEEFAKSLTRNPIQVQVRRLGDGKYYFGGRTQEQAQTGAISVVGGKMVLCRLMEYGRVGAAEEDSGVSSGESHSGIEDDLLQKQQRQTQQQQKQQQPRWGISAKITSVLRRPEPAASPRMTRPRARSDNSAAMSSVALSGNGAGKNRKVLVRVGGGWRDLDVFLAELAVRQTS